MRISDWSSDVCSSDLAARVRSPLKRFSSQARYFTPPWMFCTASNGLPTTKRFAVAGISCIRTCDPSRDSALGLKADSAWMTEDGKRVVWGKSVHDGVELGAHGIIKNNNQMKLYIDAK